MWGERERGEREKADIEWERDRQRGRGDRQTVRQTDREEEETDIVRYSLEFNVLRTTRGHLRRRQTERQRQRQRDRQRQTDRP